MRHQVTVRKRKLNRKNTKKVKKGGGKRNCKRNGKRKSNGGGNGKRKSNGGGNFGELEETMIKKFKYDTFVNATSIKVIGAGENGFVNDIVYEVKDENEDLISHAVLKSVSGNPLSDSLVYEYFVGTYVNTLTKRFPCFIETYSLLKYNDKGAYEKIKDNKIEANNLSEQFFAYNNADAENQMYTLLNTMCKDSTTFAILIQYLQNNLNVWDEIVTEKPNYLIIFELMHILFQIYIPLATIRNTFTHNDLHQDNVVLYKPFEKGYIQYNYIFGEGKNVSFKSQYMVKIIDYGRCFFDYAKMKHNTEKFYQTLGRIKECNNTEEDELYGSNHGFSFFYWNELRNYPNPRKRNISGDLLFMQVIKDILESIKNGYSDEKMNIKLPPNYLFNKANDLPEKQRTYLDKCMNNLEKVINLLVFDETNKKNTTMEYSAGFTDFPPKHIYNVVDAAMMLQYAVKMPFYKEINDFLYPDDANNRNVTLNIDMVGDKPMTYSFD